MSKIEWTGKTWNPIAGCTIVSPGCKNCYAMKMAGRLEAMGQSKYVGLTHKVNGHRVWTGKISAVDATTLLVPVRRKAPTLWFVNSMSDLFHEGIDIVTIARIVAVMVDTPRHTYQVLTKRTARMADLLNDRGFWKLVRAWLKGNLRKCAPGDHSLDDSIITPPNVWWGTSCEDQKRADERIPHLLRCPASVRFLSVEPLLGPVHIDEILVPFGDEGEQAVICPLTGEWAPHEPSPVGDGVIHWVIVGSESGHNRREMKTEWAESIARQCRAAGVSFFMKQMEVAGKVTGEIEAFPASLQVREFPADLAVK